MPQNSTDYRTYLDPAVVSKLKFLELKARMVVEGFMVGLHRSPYHGFSVEFSEHRAYQQGDPIKNIDWKVYGKSEKYFIKQFEEETNLICHVLLDVSKSMNFKYSGKISKLEYGKILSASLIYLLLSQQDAAGLTLYSKDIIEYLPPKANMSYLKKLLTAINNVSASNRTDTAACLKTVTEKIKKRGLVIIISDFFDELDSVISALKNFHFKKNEVIVFQILDPIELDFAFQKDAIFVDMETSDEITTQPYQIQNAYINAMKEFTGKLKEECLKIGIEYNLLSTNTNFDKALFSYFKKRSRLN